MSGPSGLVRIGITGERSRRAEESFGRASADLVQALRRTLPFLTRKHIAVVAAPPRTTFFSDLGTILPNIAFTAPFQARSTGACGVVAIDAQGISRILDGVLGGGEQTATELKAGSLSSAQSALAARVSAGIVRAFAEVLRSKLGLVIEAANGAAPAESGACAVLSFAIAGGGVIALAMPVAMLSDGEAPSEANDPRIAAAMIDVEVDVVAELGKVRVSLQALAALAVGDVLQLPLPLDERARVCAGGAVLFRGRPTASGLAIGIAIERHAT